MIVERAAAFLEQVVEHIAQGEDGGADIDALARDLDGAQFSARSDV